MFNSILVKKGFITAVGWWLVGLSILSLNANGFVTTTQQQQKQYNPHTLPTTIKRINTFDNVVHQKASMKLSTPNNKSIILLPTTTTVLSVAATAAATSS